jgi:hypothetical protein
LNKPDLFEVIGVQADLSKAKVGEWVVLLLVVMVAALVVVMVAGFNL